MRNAPCHTSPGWPALALPPGLAATASFVSAAMNSCTSASSCLSPRGFKSCGLALQIVRSAGVLGCRSLFRRGHGKYFDAPFVGISYLLKSLAESPFAPSDMLRQRFLAQENSSEPRGKNREMASQFCDHSLMPQSGSRQPFQILHALVQLIGEISL